MKKILLTIVAGMLMTANVMAQEANQNRPERRQMDPKEMVKQRTNETVEKYKLSEEQAAKLLDLNTKFMGKIPMGPMYARSGTSPTRSDGTDATASPAPTERFSSRSSPNDGSDGQSRGDAQEHGGLQCRAEDHLD